MVAEKGIVAAVDAMKADFDSLHKTLMDTLGPEATAQILGPFGGAFATLSDETLRPIFDGIDGITQAMTGLTNAGYLSIDQFGAMQTATTQLFDEAIAGGADMRTALLAVAPGIKAAISAAEQFGVPLDADMARLKAIAEQNGITFATDPQAAMLDVLVSIAQVLGADVPASALRARNAMTELAASVPRDLDVNLNVNCTYRDHRRRGWRWRDGSRSGSVHSTRRAVDVGAEALVQADQAASRLDGRGALLALPGGQHQLEHVVRAGEPALRGRVGDDHELIVGAADVRDLRALLFGDADHAETHPVQLDRAPDRGLRHAGVAARVDRAGKRERALHRALAKAVPR